MIAGKSTSHDHSLLYGNVIGQHGEDAVEQSGRLHVHGYGYSYKLDNIEPPLKLFDFVDEG